MSAFNFPHILDRSRRPNSQDKNKQEESTDLPSELSDIKRHQLSPGLVTVSNVLKGFGGVLASFFDEDFVTARVLWGTEKHGVKGG
jgi:hypothetical protein